MLGLEGRLLSTFRARPMTFCQQIDFLSNIPQKCMYCKIFGMNCMTRFESLETEGIIDVETVFV